MKHEKLMEDEGIKNKHIALDQYGNKNKIKINIK